jgi:DNA-binding LacI/PurR family transcriptional regulator
MPTISKSKRVENFFRSQIQQGIWSPGMKLPEAEQISLNLGVGSTTVKSVMSQLANTGLLQRIQNRGTFISSNLESKADTGIAMSVDFLFFEDPEELEVGNFANDFLGCWVANQRSMSESLQVRCVKEESRLQEVLTDILHRKPPIVITMGVDIPHLFALQEMKQQGIICLNLFPNVVELIPPSLAIQEEDVVRAQVEHLFSLGHRKIAYLHAAREDSYFRGINSRRESFYKLCLEFHLDICSDWVRYVGWKPEDIRREVHQIMEGNNHPTAMIIYDNYVNPVYAELRACKFVPGTDISLVGTDDMPWAAHVDPPLTSVRIPRMRATCIAREMMADLLSHKDLVNRFLETNLVIRQSTSPLKTE